jgi:tetratricopeptide (TPR) repeat protein
MANTNLNSNAQELGPEPNSPAGQRIIKQMNKRLEALDVDGARDLLDHLPSRANDRLKIIQAGALRLRNFADRLRREDAATYAVEFLRKEIAASPSEADLHNELGLACASVGTLAKSPEHFTEARQRYDTALELNSKAQKPNNEFQTRVIINKAVSLWQFAILDTKNSATLLSDASNLLQPLIHTNHPEFDSTLFYRVHEVIGNILVAQDNIDDGLKHLKKALKALKITRRFLDQWRILNNIGFAYQRIAIIHENANLLEDALASYTDALALVDEKRAPVEWSTTQLNIGIVLRMLPSSSQSDKLSAIQKSVDVLESACKVCTPRLSSAINLDIVINLAYSVNSLYFFNPSSKTGNYAVELYSYVINNTRNKSIFESLFKDASDYRFTFIQEFMPQRREHLLLLLNKIVTTEHILSEEWTDLSAEVADRLAQPEITAEPLVAEFGTSAESPSGYDKTRNQDIISSHVAATASLPPASPFPENWEEAKAQVPGLKKWVEVKREAGLTVRREGFDQEVYDLMVTHLRDERGLAKWATSPLGLPRNVLRRVDSGLLQELYHLGNPELPPDIRLPQGKSTGRPQGALDTEKREFAPRPNQGPRKTQKEVPSLEEVRTARRIIRRAERASNKDR